MKPDGDKNEATGPADAEPETRRTGIRCARDGAKEGREKEGIPWEVRPHDTDYPSLGDKFSAT